MLSDGAYRQSLGAFYSPACTAVISIRVHQAHFDGITGPVDALGTSRANILNSRLSLNKYGGMNCRSLEHESQPRYGGLMLI